MRKYFKSDWSSSYSLSLLPLSMLQSSTSDWAMKLLISEFSHLEFFGGIPSLNDCESRLVLIPNLAQCFGRNVLARCSRSVALSWLLECSPLSHNESHPWENLCFVHAHIFVVFCIASARACICVFYKPSNLNWLLKLSAHQQSECSSCTLLRLCLSVWSAALPPDRSWLCALGPGQRRGCRQRPGLYQTFYLFRGSNRQQHGRPPLAFIETPVSGERHPISISHWDMWFSFCCS